MDDRCAPTRNHGKQDTMWRGNLYLTLWRLQDDGKIETENQDKKTNRTFNMIGQKWSNSLFPPREVIAYF